MQSWPKQSGLRIMRDFELVAHNQTGEDRWQK